MTKPFGNSIKITKSYTSQYPDPICFVAGAVLQVVRGDSEFPGWYWCRTEAGKEGWVHQSFLVTSSGTTTSIREYSARELTVMVGERGTLLQVLDDWAYLRLDEGSEGWIPQSHVGLPED